MSILGYTTKRWPLWKSATKWDSEILNLGTSFDTQPHISFCNRKHRVMRTCEASAATVYVSFLTKFLQEATRVLGKACWVSVCRNESLYIEHSLFCWLCLAEFGARTVVPLYVRWINLNDEEPSIVWLTQCLISSFQPFPSCFIHSFSAKFQLWSVQFYQFSSSPFSPPNLDHS